MIPPRNRKSEAGNPPPTARALEFYPDRSPLPLSCRALIDRWCQSVIMGLSSGESVGTVPRECAAPSEENRGRLVWLDPRWSHPDERRTTLAEDHTCREAAYLNLRVERTA